MHSWSQVGEVEAAGTSLGSSGFSYDHTRNDSGRITAKREQIEGATSKFAYSYDTVSSLPKSTTMTTTATAPTR